jgi:hypothetical protein
MVTVTSFLKFSQPAAGEKNSGKIRSLRQENWKFDFFLKKKQKKKQYFPTPSQPLKKKKKLLLNAHFKFGNF